MLSSIYEKVLHSNQDKVLYRFQKQQFTSLYVKIMLEIILAIEI